MSKRVKSLMSQQLAEGLSGRDSCVMVGIGPMPVERMNALRTELRNEGMSLRVLKNSVALHALAQVGWEPVGGLISGTSALAFGEGGALVASKVLVDWEKKSSKELTIRGGFLDGKLLDDLGVRKLATIPDKPTLYSMLASAVVAPVAQVAALVDDLLSGVARAVGAVAEKQGEGA